MKISPNAHLTYCTNIHPGETWDNIFNTLKTYTLAVKEHISPNKPFGIGLRLSNQSAKTLLSGQNLFKFKTWLDQNNLYVFTINGFPYGEFHYTVVKDQVHTPDWTTVNRVNYTKNLIQILAYILPTGIEGGISTSPLSYKHWFQNETEIESIKKEACSSLIKIVLQLIKVKISTGKMIHLDIEPEPDGFLENTKDVIDFYTNYLFTQGASTIQTKLKCSYEMAKAYILDHLQICYDICHFALAYETPEFVITTLQKSDIKIGKIQISAAIKCKKSQTNTIKTQQECLISFNEPTYLHQSVIKLDNESLVHFTDLEEGISLMDDTHFIELRTHFHVPVFVDKFQVLQSTQDEIITALNLWKSSNYSTHLEVETYTWNILPAYLQTDITSSIIRELEWVEHQLLD